MCAIVGIFNYAKSVSAVDYNELLAIRDTMITRGPDSADLWIAPDKCIGLAHRRLAIIDLSTAGVQPMVSQDGYVRIVFNGEIYNYLELREKLINNGYQFRTNTDTEVLICLYQAYGREMVHHIRGMFAFAIWDQKHRGIFLVRDHFGIKPLYYADDGSTIRIASQVKALLKGSSSHINTSPEAAGYVGYYLWGSVPEPYTLYKGIRALPAGSTLWIDETSNKVQTKYFDLFSELRKFKLANSSLLPQQAQEQLNVALTDSVRHHLISDVPLGIFLNGGLDSSTIVALANQIGVPDLRTITLGFSEFNGHKYDEVALAEQTAEYYGTSHHTQMVDKVDFLAHTTRMFAAMDQPSIDGVNSYFACKVAKDNGLKVILSGLGGDELFLGYDTFREVPLIVKHFAKFNSINWLGRGFRYISAPVIKHFTSPKYAGLLEYGTTMGGAYLLRRGFYMPWELPSVLDADMIRQGWYDLQVIDNLNHKVDNINNPQLQVSGLELDIYMQNRLLRDSDWASMAHSLELRVPLVDISLFRSVFGLRCGGYMCSKNNMAASPQKSLPPAVLNRGKTGFSIPVREWLMNSAEYSYSKIKPGLKSWADIVLKQSHNLYT